MPFLISLLRGPKGRVAWDVDLKAVFVLERCPY